MPGPRIGSLFSGAGMLAAGVRAVIGGDVVWHCEYEPPTEKHPNPTQAAARVLEHRYPGVPNHGDVSKVDWATVQLIDVLTGGFPCQDLSLAGVGAGMRPGTRSGQWTHFAHAIAVLRPRLVLIENVRGILSAPAERNTSDRTDSDVESCAWCVGDDDAVDLRALGCVLGDLADIGMDARWVGLRAADVGAPHGRFRIFIAAWPADTEGAGLEGDWAGGDATQRSGSVGDRRTAPDAAGWGSGRGRNASGQPGRASGLPSRRCADAAADTTCDVRDERWTEPARLVGGPDAAQRGAATAAHADSEGQCSVGRIDTLERDADRRGRVHRDGHETERSARIDWGIYGSAIRRGVINAASEDRPCEDVQELRPTVDAQEVFIGAVRGPDGVPTTRALLAGVREQSSDSAGRFASLASAPSSATNPLRDVRRDDEASRAPQGPGRHEQPPEQLADPVCELPPDAALGGRPRRTHDVDFGPYEAAIQRWEAILVRSAPPPTEHGPKGGQRLSPRFTEFMMGWPDGWVTDVPGITRNEALKICGNGVAPQQAAAACELLGVRALLHRKRAA